MAELDFTDLFEQLDRLHGRPRPPRRETNMQDTQKLIWHIIALEVIVVLAIIGVFICVWPVKPQSPSQPPIVEAEGQPAAWVADGIYEIPAYVNMTDGSTGWCWKTSLQRFEKDHPDERIVSAITSFPDKYFIFTVKKVRAEIE